VPIWEVSTLEMTGLNISGKRLTIDEPSFI